MFTAFMEFTLFRKRQTISKSIKKTTTLITALKEVAREVEVDKDVSGWATG